MRYIQSFSTSGDVQTAIDNGSLGKPYVAYVESDGAIDWNTKFIDYSGMPLTLKMLSGGTLTLTGAFNKTSYSINGGDFVNIGNGARVTVDVIYGDKIIFRQINSDYPQGFATGVPYEAYGNPFYYNNPGSVNSLSSAFYYASIVSAKNLILTEATNCTDMFNGCTSLTESPEVPLNGNKYNMFNSCKNVNYIKCLDANPNTSNYINWVSGVASTGTFVKKSGASWTTGNSGIPTGWTVIEE